MEILAIIPARGGSKGFPGKNIFPLKGHPLIAYSVAAAISSPSITRTICTTDSEEIAEVARQYGAETPFLRPSDISGDVSTDLESFTHALEWLQEIEGYRPDIVVQLRPTSPLRTVAMVESGISLLTENPDIDSVRAVSEPDHTPYKMWTLDSSNTMTPLLKLQNNAEPYNTQRQLLPEIFAQTGSLEVIRTDTILKKKSRTGSLIKGLVIDSKFFIDIDTKESLMLAELIIDTIQAVRP